MPVYRRFGRAALDHITGAGGAVTDSQSGFRALNKKAALSLAGMLKVDDFSIESEIMRCSHDLNLRMAEVQIQCRYGDFDTSAKNPVSQGVGVPGSVIRLIAEKRPLFYIGVPGFISCLVGVFFGIRLLQVYNQTRFFSLREVIKMSHVITEFESKVERDLKWFKSDLHGVFSEACEMLGWRDTVIV